MNLSLRMCALRDKLLLKCLQGLLQIFKKIASSGQIFLLVPVYIVFVNNNIMFYYVLLRSILIVDSKCSYVLCKHLRLDILHIGSRHIQYKSISKPSEDFFERKTLRGKLPNFSKKSFRYEIPLQYIQIRIVYLYHG